MNLKSVLSFLLALVIVFSSFTIAFAKSEKREITSQGVDIFGIDLEPMETSKLIKIYSVLRTIGNFFTGKLFSGDDGIFEVTMCNELNELCKYMDENSCLDPYLLLTNLPDITSPGFAAIKVFNLDVTAFRNKMYEKKEEFSAAGDNTKATLCRFIGAYFSGIEKAHLELVPLKEEGSYEIMCRVFYTDGESEALHSNMYINLNTGKFYGPDGKGAGGIGFNCSVYELLVYCPMYSWMRNFGFCVEYDLLTYMLPSIVYRYNTRRFKFDYNNKEWMIQIWKGNYFISNGAEVGVYNRDKKRFGTKYDTVSDDERLNMSLKVFHGDEKLIDIKEGLYWWVNGFKICTTMYAPRHLTMAFTIEMKDEQMLNAFCKAVDKNIYKDVTYTTDGLKVSLKW